MFALGSFLDRLLAKSSMRNSSRGPARASQTKTTKMLLDIQLACSEFAKLTGNHGPQTCMEISTKNKIHVVAVPCPAQSHISVMMHLCKRIAQEPDFLVSFVNLDSIHEQMQSHWTGPSNIRLESIACPWKLPHGFDAYCSLNKGLFTRVQEDCYTTGLQKLVHRLNEEVAPVSCIVSDYFLPWAQVVAVDFGIPRIALFPGCAGWSVIEFQLQKLMEKGHLFHSGDKDCWIDDIEGLSPMLRSDLPLYIQDASDQLWVDHSLRRSATMREASWTLSNTFDELESDAVGFMRRELGDRFLATGPLFLLDNDPKNVVLRPEDAGCMEWLDKQSSNSVLYISFGSIAVLTEEQFLELADALEVCKRPFLWVIRSDLLNEGEGCHEGFFQRTKDQGMVVSWAPQLKVLEHPSVGAFFTHGGWNSMLESISNGVPMLGLPWSGEQNTNCKFMMDDWGIGVRLARKKNEIVAKEELLKWITFVFQDEDSKQMRSRVRELKAVCRQQALERAETNLKTVLDQLRAL